MLARLMQVTLHQIDTQPQVVIFRRQPKGLSVKCKFCMCTVQSLYEIHTIII